MTAVSLKLVANKANFTPQEVALLGQMKAWLAANVPADLKWDTNAPPLQK